MKYIVNIPVYQYNTGRADNQNTLFKHQFAKKEEAQTCLDFVNTSFEKIENEIELDEKDSEKYQDLFDLPGYQTKEAYITILTETRV